VRMCEFYELSSSHAREITVKPEILSSDYDDVSREISRSSYSQLRSPELRCAPVNAIRSLDSFGSRIKLNFRLRIIIYIYIYIYIYISKISDWRELSSRRFIL